MCFRIKFFVKKFTVKNCLRAEHYARLKWLSLIRSTMGAEKNTFGDIIPEKTCPRKNNKEAILDPAGAFLIFRPIESRDGFEK